MNVFMPLIVLVFLLLPVTAKVYPLEEKIKSPLLEKAWELSKSGRHAEAVTALSGYKPDNESLAQYHYIYAKALDAEDKPYQAMEHFSAACLYSPKGEMKEFSCLKKADMFIRMRYFYEAKSLYLIFIRIFPDSEYLEKAYLGLARSNAGTGSFKEAIGNYEKAGNLTEAVFGRANVLQRLGMRKEADEAYARALSKDSTFISQSDETLYYYGENLRISGRFQDAKKYLSSVKDPLFRGKAEISLGLIAMKESLKDEAVSKFKAALLLPDRSVRRQALLNLADIDAMSGRESEAKERLEEIRKKYPYGSEYDEAILRLSSIYYREAKITYAVSLLKELVLRASPRKEALDEFETIILDARKKDKSRFLELWSAVGPWLLDSSRENFLLDIADDLKNTGRPFFEVYQYLAKYGTEKTKVRSLAVLAGFYAEMGDTDVAGEYLKRIRAMKGSGDEVTRVEAKVAYSKKDLKTAAERILSVKKLRADDLMLLGGTLRAAKDQEKALVRYEKTVMETGAGPDTFIKIGDINFENGKRKEALKFYRLALDKEPGNEWALYRTGILTEGPEAEALLRKAEKGKSALNNLSGAILREMDTSRKLTEVF